MNLVLALILFPLLAGLLLLVVQSDFARRVVVGLAVAVVAVLSVWLAATAANLDLSRLPADAHRIGQVLFGVELLLSAFLLWVGIRSRNAWVLLLIVSQAGLMIWFELRGAAHVEVNRHLAVDQLSVIMALINGLVGGAICLYALGYMREYHETAHRETRDRRPLFFALLFVFMSAMFGLIFANNLVWLFLCWEITTICSFLLIGYTQTDEAKRNALRALVMNLAGGLAFAGAIVFLQAKAGTIEMDRLIASGQAVALVPAALLCFAGITKSAQLPFSSWLLGAMVAPTPVSALLHSSTMVKAGVYLALRMAPVVAGTVIGMSVALVGGVTFVIASLAAITVRDAKRVLAWSTVANLGLVILCAGIGTAEAVWAGVLLIIFHAVAKCLLFLSVGVIEHKIHSRDIEDMSGLVVTMPRLAIMMQIGIAGMFLAPFGMLMSKWAVLKAVVDASPVLSVFIVFGSAATLFFWVKWMGKLLEVIQPGEPVRQELLPGQAVALYSLATATALACVLFPLISSTCIEPYTLAVFGKTASLGTGNNLIMVSMMALVVLFPVAFIRYGRGVRVADAYLGGANADDSAHFRTTADSIATVAMGNYYLNNLFDESSLSRWGVAAATTVLAAMLLLLFL
ncbi:MAG TPA: NADH-quinone oxidoreductase subunit L [Verrucomicrobia bacterium]|nr:NADH-quinone oxidoreductase subunit L [Verrucomicrobiota bacterium]